MSRKLGNFDPASTATTIVETTSTTDSFTKLVLNFNNNATDAGPNGVTVSGGAYTSTAKFGTHSLDGDVNFPVGTFDIDSSLWTLECFLYQTGRSSNNGTTQSVVSSWGGGDSARRYRIHCDNGYVGLSASSDGYNFYGNIADNSQIPLNTWQHCAWTRNGTQIKVFRNGSLVATGSAGAINPVNAHVVGKSNNGNFNFNGYIDDLRILQGINLYTSSYTVPTSELTKDIVATVTETDTRSHSHVWNYSDVYDARFADTWPTENASIADVTIKAWGAGGGGGWWNGGSAGSGGAGGFAQGTSSETPGDAALTLGQSVYVVVGTGGFNVGTNNEGSKTAAEGGNGSANKYGSHRGGSGGGFSGVFTGSSGGDVTQSNALVIAGGGGGGSSFDRSGADESGGGGGGTTGGQGKGRSPGGGGTQSAGGNSADGDAGTALKGGNVATSEGTNMAAGGGGGGYFGGGAGSVTGSSDNENTGGGGGGSGFVKTGFTSTSLLNGSRGDAGNTSGKVTAIASAASADADYSSGFGLGGGFNSTGGNGYVVIIDGAGTNVFTSSQAYTIR